jgi:OOP family OmpA-OmpF porin
MRPTSPRIIVVILSMLVSMPALAAEIITAEDIVEKVIPIEMLVPMTDNAIFMLDTSSSMGDEYKDTGKSRLELVMDQLEKRNAYIPELGYKFGFYVYTPWKPILEMQTYNREAVANALKAVPRETSGPTRLSRGLDKLKPILKTLSGKTVVFVFSDGNYTGERRPRDVARALARDHQGVCFYVISTASEAKNKSIAANVASINECSRVIPFDNFLNHPEYTSGALFAVKASAVVVTRTESRIVGLELDPLHFAFDSTELNSETRSEVDEVGEFMGKNPGSYVVINGYTDNTGPEEYNLHLSRRRAESVGAYLTDSHEIDPSRIVLYWYGPLNPVASNDTKAGRAENRRLEMAVGGL